jgi:hypothetical protein
LARTFRDATGLGLTATALLVSGALSATATAGGFDSFLDGGEGQIVEPVETSVLTPSELLPEIGFGDPSGGEGGYDSAATVDAVPRVDGVYPGSEPGFIPYGGGADGGFSTWNGPVDFGGGLLRPVSPRWVVQTDALFLWQGNIGSRPLYLNNKVTTTQPNPFPPPDTLPTTALDINQTANEAAVGPRIGVIFNLDNIYSVEGNYFNVRPFNGEQSTPPTAGAYQGNNLAGLKPIDSPGFQDIDWAQATTNASIMSAELNWRRRTCGPVTWLSGFRWVEWNQSLQVLDSYGTTDPTAVVQSERITTNTINDLYGGQAGADVMLWNNGGPIRFNAVGKAGVFLNNAVQHTNGFSEGQLGPLSAAAQQTAFFGELGIFGTWQLTDWLAWRTGYNFFWLSGVAVPVDQLNTTDVLGNTATINTNGSVFLNGVQFGLESRW